MFNLFNCSAFEISTSVQTINDILFPVVLFVVIFWLMCELSSVDVAVEDNLSVVDKEFTSGIVQTRLDKDITSHEAKDDHVLKNLLVDVTTTIDDYKKNTELHDVDAGRQNLKALGTRKLRDFCRNSKIKGYASAYNRGGLDGLVDFLLAQQIHAHYIEQQFKHVETLARGH